METTSRSRPWEGSAFHMVDVGEKSVTRRTAEAQGKIYLSPESFLALAQGKNPKGNVLALAEVAGINAAKKTSELIPLCHPLPLDRISLRFELDGATSSLTVFCEAITHAKTGVEMEALTGVSGALLAIYDLSKAVDPVIRMGDIRLNVKEGGKHGRWTHPDAKPREPVVSPSLAGVRASILTISDRVSEGKATDLSGPAIEEFLSGTGADIISTAVVPDDKEAIALAMRREILEKRSQLVISTGGTGLGPRDVTPEAVALVADRLIPGFGERLRLSGSQFTQHAWLSRSGAATLGESLILSLPGSERAVREGLDAVGSLLPHALKILQGGGHGK